MYYVYSVLLWFILIELYLYSIVECVSVSDDLLVNAHAMEM